MEWGLPRVVAKGRGDAILPHIIYVVDEQSVSGFF